MSESQPTVAGLIWNQPELFPPSMTTLDLRLTLHGPSGTALIGATVYHGEPGDLVLSTLATSVPLLDVTDQALVLLLALLDHELATLSPF